MLLIHAPFLSELYLNQSCYENAEEVRLLTQIRGLRVLSISSPTRALLQELPAWLQNLQPGLRELHLKVRRLLFCFLLLP